MNKSERGRLGALAKNAKYSHIHIDNYNENPNVCLFCGSNILIPEGKTVRDVKRKKFCNSSCSAKYNNAVRSSNKKISTVENKIPYIRPSALWNITKGELFSSRGGYQSARSEIVRYARKTMRVSDIEKKCVVCGYDKHVEICHKVAVAKFPDTSTLLEINSIENLMYLCPNHHWEFDRGLILVG